jgi:FtsP/CotA-like multicopper oxidase with cupredoxin domain
MNQPNLNRRQFLFLGATTFGSIYLSKCASAQNQVSPLISRQEAGGLEVSLEAGYGAVNLAGRQAYLLSYNGQIPGPKLEVNPGDTLRIRFTNKLSQPTNLHYHGLHITPQGTGDNVFRHAHPGETIIYEFTLPKNHPAGTFWYHPHHHGLVAEQVFGGLAGLLIVRGDLDNIPEIKAAQEQFLVFKDFELDGNGYILPPYQMAQMMGREGSLLTVNGKINPNLSIAKGGLVRWRCLNASASRFYRLSLEEHPFYLIATDGRAIGEVVELQELLLAPGERADVLIRGDRQPGSYRLLNLPYNRGSMGMMGGGMMGPGRRRGGRMGPGRMGGGMMGQWDWQTTTTLATLTYSGQVKPLPLPEKLIPVVSLPQPKILRRFELNHSMATGMGMVFLINDRVFDEKRVDTRVRLNTVEDWEIINTGVMAHPFHLHINPFQVISRNGIPTPYAAWKDTVVVSPGERVRCRLQFQDFSGKTVYHCHIFDHEDLGMMGILEIGADN